MAIQKMRVVSEEKDVGQDPVLDKDLTTAPGSPSEGDRYILAGIGGAWSTGTINDITHYTNSAWTFLTPTKGMEVYADDEDIYYHWDGSSWEARATGGGGGGGGAIGTYQTTFVNGDLSSGILTVNHNLAEQYVETEIYDNVNKKIVPDEVTLTNSNTLTIDLSTFGTISGTWTLIVIAGSSASLIDADGDTKIQVEESEDEDKIRFDIAGTEQIILQDGALLPTTDNDVDLGSASKKFKDLYLSGSSLHLGDLVLSKNKINKMDTNAMLNAFRVAINGSLTQFNMIDGIVDEYEDESGVDVGASVDESYDSGNDFYEPTGSGGLPSSEYSSDADTKLLLHLNNNVTDVGNTVHTVTNNNVTFSSGTKKFGSDSAYFNGTNAYLTVPDHVNWDFDGDFTIDFWVRITSGGNQNGRVFALGINDSKSLQLTANGTITYDNSNFSPTTIGDLRDDTWHHIAIIRYGTGTNNIKAYVDGIMISQYTTNDTMVSASGLKIGHWWGAGDRYFEGYIDEFRISKGIARWTSNFNIAVRYNMTLISNPFTADAQPDSARIVLFEEDVSAITLNTDLEVRVSRDGGTTKTQGTLTKETDYETGKQILTAEVDLSSQPAGTSMKYEIKTLNEKNLKIHGAALSWD